MIPVWVKLAFTALALVVVPVYWRDLGPTNLLWFSDIALIVLVPALWLENRLLNSMMAVGVLAVELGWLVDFITGGQVIGLAGYMFDPEVDLHIRLLSGAFHLALPPVMLLMLSRLGYDPRALPRQCILAVIVMFVTYLLTDPSDNINWAFGPGEPQAVVPPVVYLWAHLTLLVGAIYLPSHWVLKRLFGR